MVTALFIMVWVGSLWFAYVVGATAAARAIVEAIVEENEEETKSFDISKKKEDKT